MGLRFPCRPYENQADGELPRGEPLRAKACSCGGHQLLDHDGLCVSCGYWPVETVERTWMVQAKRMGYGEKVAA